MKFDPEGNVTSFGELHDSVMTKKCNRSISGNEQQCVVSHVSLFSFREKENGALSGTWVAGKRPEIPTSRQHHITK